MTLKEFNSNYIYKADKNYDDWAVGKPDGDGKYRMDCESYVLTLIDSVDGYSKLEPYFCYLNGEGHCIGYLGSQWIDCNTKQLMTTIPSNYTGIRKIYLPELWLRKLKGKVLSLFYKDN